MQPVGQRHGQRQDASGGGPREEEARPAAHACVLFQVGQPPALPAPAVPPGASPSDTPLALDTHPSCCTRSTLAATLPGLSKLKPSFRSTAPAAEARGVSGATAMNVAACWAHLCRESGESQVSSSILFVCGRACARERALCAKGEGSLDSLCALPLQMAQWVAAALVVATLEPCSVQRRQARVPLILGRGVSD